MMGNENGSIKQRAAGILMHITSLPGPAYTGDLGPSAKKFADFLHNAGQSYWQLLPLQPTGADQGFSPYSSSSSVAGNLLLISPELLAEDGLIPKSAIAKGKKEKAACDFSKAAEYKTSLLETAWTTWREKKAGDQHKEFDKYREAQDYWLNDFALYALFKQIHEGRPWYEWPEKIRNRDEQELARAARKHRDELEKIKWVQMVFDRQWHALREYCKNLNIRLIGDVPFYVAHDSADVWSHRDMFAIDDKGAMTGIAGVPPDLFNDEGQLWGMPLFKWHRLKENGYEWWLRRLQKNLDYFDIVRLDHFRAFSSYWAVPAGSSTAKTGKWEKGPGAGFFKAVQKKIGALPFIAEDLGEIDDDVYQLRDEFNLPGMNVLQFAFGDDMPRSPYLPHNHISNSLVYTGTHDNNTTIGWYKDSGGNEKKNINAYCGVRSSSSNICDVLTRLAYMSTSNLVVLPMQDVLQLDADARMNMPASTKNNWVWRATKDQLSEPTATKLSKLATLYDRLRARSADV